MRHSTRTARHLIAIVIAGAVAVSGGCTMFDHDNRRTLNALDEHLAPESTGARWALVPVALPTGLLALAADAIVVHPITAIDDAFGDTVELLWTARGESGFRQAVMTPLAAIATPFVFVGDWAGRSLFPIGPRADVAEDTEDASQ